MSYRGNDQAAIVFKTDKTSVKQMVDARCQQQSVLAIQSLFIGESRHGLQWLAIRYRILNPPIEMASLNASFATLCSSPVAGFVCSCNLASCGAVGAGPDFTLS